MAIWFKTPTPEEAQKLHNQTMVSMLGIEVTDITEDPMTAITCALVLISTPITSARSAAGMLLPLPDQYILDVRPGSGVSRSAITKIDLCANPG